ncbi:MAG: hypothetical protein V7750_00900 [Sneathiella sp.]
MFILRCFRGERLSIPTFGILIAIALMLPVSVEAKTVLIVNVDDAQQGDLASNLYKKVVSRISEHLEDAGFQTREDEVKPMAQSESFAQESDEALLERVRLDQKRQVDYIALVQILANTVLLESGTRIEVEILGRMLKVSNGDVLARFNLPVPNNLNAPPSCNLKCIVQLLEDNTTLLADSLGQVLAKRLQGSQ